MSLTPVGGTAKTVDVPATVWRAEEDGWNTVLLAIPESDYTTEVTAKAFITVGGVEYETQAVTSTIAKTAATAMATGKATEAEVGHYVSLDAITLDKETAVMEGETLQLTATTAPAGYAVKWTSSNEAIATVDANGVVTAVGGGRVTITASMAGKQASCEVLVPGAATIVDFNSSHLVPGYTTAGNGSAIQSYYGYSASGSKVPVGYSGLTTGDQILYQAAGGVTGNALAFNYFWRTVSGDPWKVGFATAWLDEVFADKHVSALQWSMKMGNTSSITGIATDVEQSWTDDMVIDAQWHVLTMTREDYYAIKASSDLTVDGFLSISATKAGTNYSAAFWWLFDEFQAVYSAEEAEDPEIEAPILSFDFNDDKASIPGYTMAGNGSAIQSYYGGKGSGSTQTVGYSGLTTSQRILFQTAGGVTGSDKALAFNFAWDCRDVAEEWKVGFSIAWLDAMFANKTVTAIQFSMKLSNTAGITGIATDVEQSWTDDMVIDAQWHTLTMTRADYEAIKAATDLKVEGFLTISILKTAATYSAAFWCLFDEFKPITA